MTGKQDNTLTMANTVQLCLTQNQAIVQLVKAFAKCGSDLNDCINNIDELLQQQEKQINGITKDKGQAKQDVIAAAMQLKAPVISYALDNNNYKLSEQLHYSNTELVQQRDNVLPNTLIMIRDTVQKELANLTDYEVKQQGIDALTAMITAYSNLNTQPRNALNTKSTATKQLSGAFETLRLVLKRMDGFVEAKKDKEPAFYATYKSARIIVGRKGKSKKTVSEKPAVQESKIA